MTVDYNDKFSIRQYGKLSDDEQKAMFDFDDLIDAYSDAHRGGTIEQRINARRELKHAFFVALRKPNIEKS